MAPLQDGSWPVILSWGNLNSSPAAALCCAHCSVPLVGSSVEASGVSSSHHASAGSSHLSCAVSESGLREKALPASSPVCVEVSLRSPHGLQFSTQILWVLGTTSILFCSSHCCTPPSGHQTAEWLFLCCSSPFHGVRERSQGDVNWIPHYYLSDRYAWRLHCLTSVPSGVCVSGGHAQQRLGRRRTSAGWAGAVPGLVTAFPSRGGERMFVREAWPCGVHARDQDEACQL